MQWIPGSSLQSRLTGFPDGQMSCENSSYKQEAHPQATQEKPNTDLEGFLRFHLNAPRLHTHTETQTESEPGVLGATRRSH